MVVAERTFTQKQGTLQQEIANIDGQVGANNMTCYLESYLNRADF